MLTEAANARSRVGSILYHQWQIGRMRVNKSAQTLSSEMPLSFIFRLPT